MPNQPKNISYLINCHRAWSQSTLTYYTDLTIFQCLAYYVLRRWCNHRYYIHRQCGGCRKYLGRGHHGNRWGPNSLRRISAIPLFPSMPFSKPLGENDDGGRRNEETAWRRNHFILKTISHLSIRRRSISKDHAETILNHIHYFLNFLDSIFSTKNC